MELDRLRPSPLGLALHYRPDFAKVSQPSILPDTQEILPATDAVVDGGGFTDFGRGFVNESVCYCVGDM